MSSGYEEFWLESYRGGVAGQSPAACYLCDVVSVQEMISEIDQDGNSQINFNEFVWLMTRLVSAS